MSLPSMVDNSNNAKLHIAMFPWLAFGHIIPYLELAKLIAQKGHKISFISTPRNIDRLPKLPPPLSHLIQFVSLPLTHLEETNLPINAEATSDIPTDKVSLLMKAFDNLQESVSGFLRCSKPDWICYDFPAYWLPPIAANLGISRAYLSIVWAASHCFLGPSTAGLINGDDPRTQPEHFTVPPKWIPSPTNNVFRLHLHEARRIFPAMNIDPASGVSFPYRFGSVITGCELMAIRSCKELEPDCLSLLGEFHQKPVVPIGLLPPSILISTQHNEDENNWIAISNLLEKHEKRSVVYIAFGSEATLSQEQITELALGLELSGLPFFWALKEDHGGFDLPNGFEKRTREQGVVWRGWVPQIRVLAHESIGGFLTHCGASSVIEGLHFGLPLIMLPLIADQWLMARAFVEMKVGVEIDRGEDDGWFTRNAVAEAVRTVMVMDESFKNKANELKKMVWDEELHRGYVDSFVHYLENH